MKSILNFPLRVSLDGKLVIQAQKVMQLEKKWQNTSLKSNIIVIQL